MSGKEVITLLNERLIPGSYAVTFNGNGLSLGIFYYTLVTDKEDAADKIVFSDFRS